MGDDISIDDLVEKCLINRKRSGFRTIRGHTMPITFEKNLQLVDDFEVHDSDIWVITFPRSGTTWTQEMVWLLANNFDYEGAKEDVQARFPFFEISFLIDWKALDKTLPEHVMDSFNYTNNMAREPRCIKCHLPWELLPNQIKNGTKKPKIIYVVRDPKDITASSYHHYKRTDSFNGNFDEFCSLTLADKLTYCPYWKHVLDFWKHRNDPNILIIRYEEMNKDLKSVAEKVACFLNKTIPEEEMDKFLNHLSFNSMKKNVAVNSEKSMLRTANVPDESKDFVRKGIVGDHKNHMTPELIKRFDEWIEENTKNTDFTL